MVCCGPFRVRLRRRCDPVIIARYEDACVVTPGAAGSNHLARGGSRTRRVQSTTLPPRLAHTSMPELTESGDRYLFLRCLNRGQAMNVQRQSVHLWTQCAVKDSHRKIPHFLFVVVATVQHLGGDSVG